MRFIHVSVPDEFATLLPDITVSLRESDERIFSNAALHLTSSTTAPTNSCRQYVLEQMEGAIDWKESDDLSFPQWNEENGHTSWGIALVLTNSLLAESQRISDNVLGTATFRGPSSAAMADEEVTHVPLIFATVPLTTATKHGASPICVSATQSSEAEVVRCIVDCIRLNLYTAGNHLWQHMISISPSSCLELDHVPPVAVAGNIRVLPHKALQGVTFVIRADVAAGEGDIAVGRVEASSTKVCEVMDNALTQEAVRSDAPPRSLWFREPLMVMAPLGNRESSTHVSGRVPLRGGATPAHRLHWIGGESGLVGELVQDGSSANPLAERSLPFHMVGTLCRADTGRAVNLADLVTPIALQEGTLKLGIPPVILVSGTSAEAGKSTWTAKIVSYLSRTRHLRVAAIKATGTGGVVDSATHRVAGAVATLDQVDAGLPTTYTSPQRVINHLPKLLDRCAAPPISADVIVCELGGDILWANNETVLTEVSAFTENLLHVFILCNDSLAALGTKTWLDARVPFINIKKKQVVNCGDGDAQIVRKPWTEMVSFVASPFRNYVGAVQRAEALQRYGNPSCNVPTPMDPNDTTALGNLLDKLLL